MLDLGVAYGIVPQAPSEPSRGASARMLHEEVERTRVAAVAAPPSVVTLSAQPLINNTHVVAKASAAAPVPAGDGRWKDMKKLVMYALVVCLGMALHYVCHDWLTRYISTAYLSESSEQLSKLCYPASIVATLWIVR